MTEFNGEDNHVHVLMENPPKVSVSSLMRSKKCIEPDVAPRLRAKVRRSVV